MIIKRIKLNNIRSYLDNEIEFKEGTTLLAGDIGAGKSSLLIAVDFALFGLQRGELAGSALLRNGSEYGSVELEFGIQDTNYIIQRVLHKTNSGITQDSGFISTDGEITKLSTVELKQKVLEILNYPQEILSKKSLIYKYTVYTPQEEMKAILIGDSESRLETLRKLFNIDKYKRVADNSRIISAILREKRKELAGKIYDYDIQKQKLAEKDSNILEIQPKLREFEEKIIRLSADLAEKKKALDELELKMKRFSELKQNHEVCNAEIKAKFDYLKKLLLDIEALNKELLDIGILVLEDPPLLNQNLELLNDELKKHENELTLIRASITESQTNKKHTEHIKQSILTLDACPTCKQLVSADYKKDIETTSNGLIINFNKELVSLAEKEREISALILEKKKDIEALKNKIRDLEFKKSKLAESEKKKLKISVLTSEAKTIEAAIYSLTNLKNSFDSDIQQLKDAESIFVSKRKEHELLLKQLHESEIEHANLKKDIEFLLASILELKKKIAHQEESKSKLNKYTQIQDFLDSAFIEIVNTMERKVMLRVHSEFNSLFSGWLQVLVNSEILTASLQEEFTPIIRQNGYDIEYENLSGGEKTACALAYRLALNQVVNNIESEIQTKDLIILDEPTDGFSPEQIDIMKDVLSQLKMKQVILVSHEPKLESFADRIIKIEKAEHVSSVVYQ